MDDYKNILIEYKSLQNMVENQANDLNLIQNKIKIFLNNINSLKDDIKQIPDIQNGSFGFLNKIFKNFVNNIQNCISQFTDIILNPLDNFIYSYKFATGKNITLFNELKSDLFEEKKILTNKRDIYFNYIKESKNQSNQTNNTKYTFFKNKSSNINININNELSSKKDENIYNNAVKENYHQLYQYELNKMNEMIDESNIKYNNIFHEINAINASYKITVRDCLIKFAKNLTEYATNLNNLSDEIIKKIDTSKILNNEEICQSVDKSASSNKPRFEKEKLEENVIIDTKEKEKEKEKNTEKKNIISIFHKKKITKLFSTYCK